MEFYFMHVNITLPLGQCIIGCCVCDYSYTRFICTVQQSYMSIERCHLVRVVRPTVSLNWKWRNLVDRAFHLSIKLSIGLQSVRVGGE